MTTSQINYLNIALMLISCIIAYVLPFELFLFSYAVLGPLHYLTEISWLHNRNYFTTGKYDYLFLLAPCIPLSALLITQQNIGFNPDFILTWFAFSSAVGMVIFKRPLQKIMLGLALLLSGVLLAKVPAFYIFIAVLLPTIIHVFVFTGAFILFGALKSKSISGYISFAVFIACALVYFIFIPDMRAVKIPAETIRAAQPFNQLGDVLLKMFNLEESQSSVFAVMRLLAYAYTYHYLNWFSKTKIIGWHEVSRTRLSWITALWLASVGLYYIDYTLGFIALFCLSFGHVVLEFPLNHISFIGIGKEIRSRLS